ncbi:helix-turn-helix domain-containing protein [Pararhizobium qamdonense]|uniref:helix-turn-helix domain-containing protein n=1 Tax=Pararhizobium qamdonense TaxID=3031126 RepID=UPI0023E177A0|nr:helix-turn-helix transcriptional regulator [Pararhizobium qamdonense]
MSSDWQKLVRDLQIEQGISERKLAVLARLNRTTLRRFLTRKGSMELERIERLLSVFGYELDAVMVGEPYTASVKSIAVSDPAPTPTPPKFKLIRPAGMSKWERF